MFSFLLTFSSKFYNLSKVDIILVKVPHTCLIHAHIENEYQILNSHGQKPPDTGFADFQNLPIFTEKFAGRVNWNSALNSK